MTDDNDMERGRLIDAKKKSRKRYLVNPTTLKVILAVGAGAYKALSLILELVKLFKT